MQSAADQALQAGRQLVDAPPEALVRLVRMVARAFYSGEHAVIIDYLCKRIIIREEDLAVMFRLDMKQLRQLLVALKQDQLVRSRKRMETSADGRVSKSDYYYINYEVFVNVVKYKLDTMQHRLEREQREFTARAAFHCTGCSKTFTDLEVDQLIDFATGEMKCSFCSAEVVEEENLASRQDLRLTMAKFHEQVRDPLDALLKDIERFRLGPNLLEPPISDAFVLDRPDGGGACSASGASPTAGGSSGASATTITVDMTSGGGSGTAGGVKEVPQWLLGSSVAQDDDSNSRFSLDGGGVASAPSKTGGAGGDAARKEEIQDLLIQHEVRQKKPSAAAPASATVSAATAAASHASGGRASSAKSTTKSKAFANYDDEDGDVDSSTSPTGSDSDVAGGPSAKRLRAAAVAADSDAETDDDDVEDEESGGEDADEGDDELAVTFQGARLPYDEVTEAMVQVMTPAEKREYAEVGQKFYAQFDD